MAGKDNITFKHKGKVVSGSLALYDTALYIQDLERHEGMDIFVEIHLDEVNHTPEQMAYFRGPITNIALQTEVFGGWTKIEFQEFMKEQFLKEVKDVKQLDGTIKEMIVIPSLGDVGIRKMKKFIEDVIQFLAEQDIIVKSPNEYNGKEA